MINGIAKEVGIFCTDRDALRGRCRVTVGLQLADRTKAYRCGYYGPKSGHSVVSPLIDIEYPDIAMLQQATDDELDTIIAGPDTKRVMQLWRLPSPIGRTILSRCITRDEFPSDLNPAYETLASELRLRPVFARVDEPDQLHVTKDSTSGIINRWTNGFPKMGDHIDSGDSDLTVLIGNAGPGIRWHRITPSFNTDVCNGSGYQERTEFMLAHPNPDSMTTFWFRLDPPNSEGTEVLIGSPVTRVLHEGSTLGSSEPSQAFFCTTTPARIGMFPSPLAPDM